MARSAPGDRARRSHLRSRHSARSTIWRRRWDALEADQRGYLADLVEIDLWKPVDGTTPEGRIFSRPLGMLLLRVPTHAAHHRSELATMLTMVSAPPPDTGINSYYREKSQTGSR